VKEQSSWSFGALTSRYAGIAFRLDVSVIIMSASLATFIRSKLDSAFIDSPNILALRLTGYSVIWIGGLYLSSSWARSNFLPGIDSLSSIASSLLPSSI